MHSNLKYGDTCVSGYHNTVDKLSITSSYFNNGKIIPDNCVSNKPVYCVECNAYSYFEINITYSVIQIRCLYCGHEHIRTIYNPEKYIGQYTDICFGLKIVAIHKKTIFTQLYKALVFKFRYDPVPKTGKFKRSHSNRGSSKKGLIWSSYKNSFDIQCINYEDEFSDVLIFKHRHSCNVYTNSGMDSFDPPYRNIHLRSWKRTKKYKQWM